MSFQNFPLSPNILKAVAAKGYETPTEIQLKAIPKILAGFDIRASAPTGTGKTASFLLPALNLCTQPPKIPGKGPRILILSPTRELAMQIAAEAEVYSRFLKKVCTICISGGVSYHPQLKNLSRPHEVLIATPGRLQDLIDRKKVNLSRVEMVVLDEADRMLDMGFIGPVEKIVAKTPTERQTLLFSATMKGSVLKLSEKLLTRPLDIVVQKEKENRGQIQERLHYVDNIAHKNRILEHILKQDDCETAIIFTSTKRHAAQLALDLTDRGHKAAVLHGDIKQNQRTKTVAKLRKGLINILVATDVAARGIDVPDISHVINFDLPTFAEDYVHRIGRTGRAGAEGTALSFAASRDAGMLRKIEQFTGHKLSVVEIAGLEAKKPQQTQFKRRKKSAPQRARKNDRPQFSRRKR